MKPPIAEPFGPPLRDEETQIFHVAILDSFVGYFLCYLLVLAPILLPILHPIRDDYEIFVFLGFMIGAAMISTFVGWCYAVEVGSSRLRGSSFWGVKREIHWEEITRVRFAWFLFRYVIISTQQKRNFIWLPLYLWNMKGFIGAVEELAPPQNPLRLFLVKRYSK